MSGQGAAKRTWTVGRISGGVRRRARAALARLWPQEAAGQDFDALHRGLVRTQAPMIVDVGAHVGESVWRFRKAFPQAQIHCFEADAGNFENLRMNVGAMPGVALNNCGAGAEAAVRTFYRNRKSNTSSFNKVNPESAWAAMRSQRQNVSIDEFTEKAYEVEIKSLDAYLVAAGIAYVDILKIDTQGYEDEVLKGCRETLAAGRIGIIETELILGDAYEKRLTFSALEALLLPYGYQFYALSHGGNVKDSPALTVDMVYVHRSLLGKQVAA